MKSYGIVKPKDTQYYNSYNVKLYEKVHPNLHIDKIVHPSPLPKPAVFIFLSRIMLSHVLANKNHIML